MTDIGPALFVLALVFAFGAGGVVLTQRVSDWYDDRKRGRFR
jgi:hypothetical protein